MERRKFLKNSIATGSLIGLGGLPLTSCEHKTEKKITILHTNDVHSHIEVFSDGHEKYPNIGGVARRASLIQSVRSENPNTLLFDAGDIFQGTPYFNYFGGEVEFKLMSLLKYDAATLGNHDFDNSIEGFHKQLPNASFDFVCANYDFKNTVLDTLIKPYKIFIKDGIKIGVFGLGIELVNLVNPNLYKETKYLDPIEISKDISRDLKEKEAVRCKLNLCIVPFDYETEDVNIVSGMVSLSNVNIHDAVSIDRSQMLEFESLWPNAFHEPISIKVVTMTVSRKHVQVGDVRVLIIDLIYSRIICL